jgi:hypothetical protein
MIRLREWHFHITLCRADKLSGKISTIHVSERSLFDLILQHESATVFFQPGARSGAGQQRS